MSRVGIAVRAKRAIDVFIAVVLGVILLIPSFFIALVIRIIMGRPILFSQSRPGYEGEIFTILKFRTMWSASSPSEVSHVERLTRFGRILRASSLDELPQIINVLRGEMSFIGPRPTTIENDGYFTKHERQRYLMRPGLTGWAQVNGRNTLSWNDRLSLDVWYVEHWSLWLDLKIAFKSVKVILSRDGFVNDETVVSGRISDERKSEHDN